MYRIITAILVFCYLVAAMGCAGRYQPPVDNNSVAIPDSAISDSTFPYPPLQVATVSGLNPELPGIWAGEQLLNAQPYQSPQPRPDEFGIRPDTSVVLIEISGYRVQLFAGRVQKHAQQMVEEATRLFSVPVYLTYEAPQYKVRLGNFESREETLEFCKQVRRKGYPGAWVVKSNVEVAR